MLKYLKTQLWILRVERSMGVLALLAFIGAVLFQFVWGLNFFLDGFRIPFFLRIILVVAAGSGLGLFSLKVIFWNSWKAIAKISLPEVAQKLEAQSSFFKKIQPEKKGELIAAAHFLESGLRGAFGSQQLEEAHIKQLSSKIPASSLQYLRPSFRSLLSIALAVVLVLMSFETKNIWKPAVPTSTFAWSPGTFEIQLPFDGAEWKKDSGAIAGVSGSKVKFEGPRSALLKTFLFYKEVGASSWRREECKKGICELMLVDRGLYAVGNIFKRSPFFPLQVAPDEPPKGVLFVRDEKTKDLIPSATVSVVNRDSLALQATASDDVFVTRVEFRHKFQADDVLLEEWKVGEPHFKREIKLDLNQWKGGSHEVYLRVFDLRRSSDSSPITIVYADEETMRQKRMLDLRAAIDEWVHVLGDLLETDHDQKLHPQLRTRLSEIHYPEVEEASLIAAYVRELQKLEERIQNWAESSPLVFAKVPGLIERTEKQILYGLSLLFQEKTGEIQQTANDLQASKADLNKLLEDLKNGKTNLDPKVLEEAFQKLVDKLAELQEKIRNLPQGPNDELLNREAMEKQADEADELSKRIDEIRKQMANGDSKGALKELESLLNQLSILSKEMEQSLDQWQKNLDQGSLQSAERYQKKLEDLKKRQDELTAKTEKLKERMEKFQSSPPSDPKKADKEQKEMGKAMKDSENVQNGISKDFNEAREAFDKDLEGSEWKEALRGEEQNEMENQIEEKMNGAESSLQKSETYEAITQEKEASGLLQKALDQQKQMREQMQQAMDPKSSQSKGKNSSEKVEILSSQGKGEKERRRKILESLEQKVDDKFQKSHEQYFEDLLQR